MFGFMIMFVLYSYTMGKAHGEGHSHDGKPELARPLILGMPSSLWGFTCNTKWTNMSTNWHMTKHHPKPIPCF
jgi:hypothetical protein